MPDALLQVKDLNGWYGESHVLHGMTFDVPQGEVVTLLGRNGAGKTTTMRAVMGMLSKRTGSVKFEGTETVGMASNLIARAGIAYCPEERGIFASLNVRENLELPRLLERTNSQGTKLSGGEQQMLAIARILRTGARFLLLDEPTEGLAPVIVQHIGQIIRTLKQKGFTVLLVEQNFHFASTVADRHYVVEHGTVVDMILNDDIKSNLGKLEEYLGV